MTRPGQPPLAIRAHASEGISTTTDTASLAVMSRPVPAMPKGGVTVSPQARSMRFGAPRVSWNLKPGTRWRNCRSVTKRATLTISAQVSWWSVQEYVTPVLERAGSYPMAGTPAWCALADDDPAKIAGIFDAARHWALRVETAQAAQCEASHDISAAADWSSVAKQIFRRRGAYIRREVA